MTLSAPIKDSMVCLKWVGKGGQAGAEMEGAYPSAAHPQPGLTDRGTEGQTGQNARGSSWRVYKSPLS